MVNRLAAVPIVGVLFFTPACAQDAKPITWRQSLGQKDAWYASVEAIRIADNVLLYQRDSGGWPKDVDMAAALDDKQKAELRKRKSWSGATIDNGATHGQIRYLAKVYKAARAERFKAAAVGGVDFLLAMQYDNGGFPQLPAAKGYQTCITFNDGAMVGALSVLKDIAERRAPLDWLDDARRAKAAAAVKKGINCILACQVVVDGERTAWGQQQDMKTLAPAPARAFEPASLCTAESVGVLQFLMSIDRPGAEVVESVRAAAAWLARVKITGVRQKIVPAEPVKYPFHASNTDKLLVEAPSAPPLWARLYEVGTNKPIYGDRDGKVHYRLSEISRERRTGYSWLGRWPAKLLETDYPAWLAKHAPDVRKQHK